MKSSIQIYCDRENLIEVRQFIADSLKSTFLTDIEVNADFNCRGEFAPIDIVDLAKSIQEKGLMQPSSSVQLHTLRGASF